MQPNMEFVSPSPAKFKNKASYESTAFTGATKDLMPMERKNYVSESLSSGGNESSDFDPNLFIH